MQKAKTAHPEQEEMKKEQTEPTAQTELSGSPADLVTIVSAIQRADCTIPRERAIAMAWTQRPDLKPPLDPIDPPGAQRPLERASPSPRTPHDPKPGK